MRPLRVLQQGAWYEIRSQINNREPLFRHSTALALFDQVFRAAEIRFVFSVRALRLEDDWLTFYIKPEDGMELPAIMKWIKQTFAQRYNALTGRIGHIWGDRYWSAVVEGEPPEGALVGGAVERGAETGVRPRPGKRRAGARLPPKSPPPATISPG
ncbi:MAG: transposase [Treponema sp.]|jgi:REP element-mobilizing transposase RayT|nr:transposase [Treponema sp.]